MKLRDFVILESKRDEKEARMSTGQKKQLAETIAKYNEYGKLLRREHSLKEIAQQLSEVASSAETFVLSEMDDWFDKITVNRNMKELKRLSGDFGKIAVEGHSVQERMEALYEDMGHILNRYFEISDSRSGGGEVVSESTITIGDVPMRKSELRQMIREEITSLTEGAPNINKPIGDDAYIVDLIKRSGLAKTEDFLARKAKNPKQRERADTTLYNRFKQYKSEFAKAAKGGLKEAAPNINKPIGDDAYIVDLIKRSGLAKTEEFLARKSQNPKQKERADTTLYNRFKQYKSEFAKAARK